MDYETMLYRMYDRVVISLDKETRDWRGAKVPPNGTQATIVGIESSVQWRGRCWEYGRAPGKYLVNNGAFRLRFDDGKGIIMNTYDFDHLDEGLMAKRQDERRSLGDDPPTDTWMEPLPELPFCEMDRVSFVRFEDEEQTGTIGRINYDYIGQFCTDDVTPMPMFQVNMDGGGSSSFRPEELKLIERGNVWRHTNGQPLRFKDIKEETSFHSAMGWDEQVRCPQTGNYDWVNVSNVLEGIRNDIVDCLKMTGSFFGAPSMHAAIRFRDRELGKRVQAKFLDGFKDYREE